ncbi:MAG: DUF1800 domain-containing protein [Candidatus Acidiferrales bacterium]
MPIPRLRSAWESQNFHAVRFQNRLDAAGAALLSAVVVFLVATVFLTLTPRADAGKSSTSEAVNSDEKPPKSFAGNLPITQLNEDEAILHALDRLAYGPRPGDVEHIRQMGLEKWIDEQLNFNSGDDAQLDAKLDEFKTLRMSSEELLEEYPPPNEVAKREGMTPEEYRQKIQQQVQAKRQELRQQGEDPAQIQFETMPGPQRIQTELDLATMDRAIYSNRQLYEVMSNFWANHFNVNVTKGADRWLVTDYVEHTIRPRAMGKFEDLLVATAKSPAMLFYLDNWLSADPVASQQMQAELAQRRQRFEGLFAGATPPQPGEFPQPGEAPGQQVQMPPKKQERGLNENYGREVMELHTLGVNGGYTQADVIQMAECLTGWTIHEPRRDPQFFFDDRIHDQSAKTVMGKQFNYGGMKDGLEALHMLATNPATAKHISFQLAQHFVSDNPPQALVNRMSDTFMLSGGDIRAVLKTMIYSPEFWSKATFRAKVKTPFEVAVSAARALDLQTTVSPQLVQWVGRMGEPLYQCEPPTGYADTADVWVNAGSLLNRLNFALTLATNHMPGTSTDLARLLGQDADTNAELALSRALDDFLGGEVSPQTRATLEKELSDPQILQARLDDPVKHVNEGLIAGLVLGAPEFQRR